MLTLRGAPALSDFRLQKLQERLRAATGLELRVYAEHMHFVDSEGELTTDELAVLEQLLRYGPSLPAHAPEVRLVLAVPRPGTISPWSSKATDIAHNCVLTSSAAWSAGPPSTWRRTQRWSRTPWPGPPPPCTTA